jgi:hypothetical protein
MTFALGPGLKLFRQDEWDADRFRPRYEEDSDASDDEDAAAPTSAAVGFSPVPPEWAAAGTAAGTATGHARASGAAVGLPDAFQRAHERIAAATSAAAVPVDARFVPPPALYESAPKPQLHGQASQWFDVGRGLQHDLGEQEAARQRMQDYAADVENARRVGIRQASLTEHAVIAAALTDNLGGQAIRQLSEAEQAQEAANAFLWSHNIVATENNVLQQSMLRTSCEGSNPYTNYQATADNMYVFATPTAGDSGTLENDFVEIVPQRSFQQRKGFWVDPRTNLVAAIYEDLPPPPQVDYSTPVELRDPDRANRYLVQLQGGWDPHNPGRTRREVEADAPLPENTNGDAAYALTRRMLQYQQVTPDIANNKGHMFPQSVDDRYPVGYVGYQDETPYADRLHPVPATLRGYVGSEWNPNNRQPEDFREFGPSQTVAQAALDCQVTLGDDDRSRSAFYARPTPVGLYEPIMGGAVRDDSKRNAGGAAPQAGPQPSRPWSAARRPARSGARPSSGRRCARATGPARSGGRWRTRSRRSSSTARPRSRSGPARTCCRCGSAGCASRARRS